MLKQISNLRFIEAPLCFILSLFVTSFVCRPIDVGSQAVTAPRKEFCTTKRDKHLRESAIQGFFQVLKYETPRKLVNQKTANQEERPVEHPWETDLVRTTPVPSSVNIRKKRFTFHRPPSSPNNLFSEGDPKGCLN